jgi:flagellin-like protein
MKRAWRRNEAVSPVIATILMVAITVVLAAVLYVMVSEYMDPNNDIPSLGTINDVDARSNSSVEISFGEFTGTAKPIATKVLLETNDGTRITLTWSSIPSGDNFPMTSSDPDVTAFYRDLNPSGNSLNAGDSIIVNGLTPGEEYEIMLAQGDSQIQLVGVKYFTMSQ